MQLVDPMDNNNPQPPFSNYPRFNQNAPLGRPPGVYLDLIGEAFTLVQQDWGTWILAALISAVISFLPTISQFILMGPAAFGFGDRNALSYNWSLYPVQFMIQITCALANVVITNGMLRMGALKALGLPITVGDVIFGFGRIGTLMGTAFLSWLAICLGTLACIIPGVYVSGVLFFAPLLSLMENRNVMDSIQTCYERCKPFAWQIFGLLVVTGLLGTAGALLCGVGLLIALPVQCVTLGMHYNLFFPPADLSTSPEYGYRPN